MTGQGAISIDVDALRFYGAIHGLERTDPDDDPIYGVGLPRFFELLDEVGVSGTVFLVAADAERAGRHLKDGLTSTRSELASHSHRHDYRLGALPDHAVREDLTTAHRVLSEIAGAPVVGFRAPGYNTSPAMLRTLVELGYAYDSSLLPAPLYYLARAAAIARYALLGRPSASMRGQLRAFAGPLVPYRISPDRPWRPDPRGDLVELPMAVEPTTRIPLIGTSWVLFPERLRSWLLDRALRGRAPFVFEMHGIDLIDRSDPGVPAALAEAQPDLRRPAREKIRAFRSLFKELAARTDVTTLRELAARQPARLPSISGDY